jgi:hypothetical protein
MTTTNINQMHESSIWAQLKSYLRGIGPLRMTRSDVSHDTGSDVSHVPCPEVCSAHAQPEVDISALVGPFDRK